MDTLIFYEDLETALRAKQLVPAFLAPAEGDNELQTNLWKIDLLRDPLLREQAALEAARSQLVVLSVHGSALPDPLKEWMRLLAERQPRHPLALALVLDPKQADPQGSNPITTQLRMTARRMGVTFFGTFTDRR